jgi:hypothetical protein
MQHETKDPVKRAVGLETERAVELFVLNLRPEIEARVAAKDPTNFQKSQEAVFKAEVRLGEIERTRNMQNKYFPESTRRSIQRTATNCAHSRDKTQ